MKILICGVSGSGKTILANHLFAALQKCGLSGDNFNGDAVRLETGNQDFSLVGREAQARKMAEMADNSKKDFVILDFIAPLEFYRQIVKPSMIIFMNTTKGISKYPDTDAIFETPIWATFTFFDYPAEEEFAAMLRYITNRKRIAPVVQMLGRFQPWHIGHTELFKRAVVKTGRVCIMVRNKGYLNLQNPYRFSEVEASIHNALSVKFAGSYTVMSVPDIVNITYGRDVGYLIEEEKLPDEIEKISATAIRGKL